MTKGKHFKRPQGPLIELTAQSILAILLFADISPERRAELEALFPTRDSISSVENDRWLRYLKSDKALPRPPKGD